MDRKHKTHHVLRPSLLAALALGLLIAGPGVCPAVESVPLPPPVTSQGQSPPHEAPWPAYLHQPGHINRIWMESGGARQYWNARGAPLQMRMNGQPYADPALMPDLLQTQPMRKRWTGGASASMGRASGKAVRPPASVPGTAGAATSTGAMGQPGETVPPSAASLRQPNATAPAASAMQARKAPPAPKERALHPADLARQVATPPPPTAAQDAPGSPALKVPAATRDSNPQAAKSPAPSPAPGAASATPSPAPAPRPAVQSVRAPVPTL
jgi:hypothetical protein